MCFRSFCSLEIKKSVKISFSHATVLIGCKSQNFIFEIKKDNIAFALRNCSCIENFQYPFKICIHNCPARKTTHDSVNKREKLYVCSAGLLLYEFFISTRQINCAQCQQLSLLQLLDTRMKNSIFYKPIFYSVPYF